MNPPRPDAFALYTTIFLTHRGELLMLRRAADRRFAPGRWTGLGGRVEGGEFGSLRASALRELREETGLGAEVLEGFTLRRMLVHDRPGGPLTGLLYFTAELTERVTPPCNEGTLHWKRPDELASLDVIETTATVIPRLVEDVTRDPAGRDAVRLGLAHVHPTGRLASVSWSESAPCYTPGMTVSATKTTTRRDDELFGLIDEEFARQRDGLELIASENFTSPAVMEAVGSVLTNKYAEGYPGRRYYGGCEVIDRVESLAIDRVKTLFDAGWANVQPHSGSSANLAVYYALLEPGDTIMGMDLSHGGHLTHGSPVNFSGIHYRVVGYQVTRDEETIDFDALRALALEHRPRLIIAGASAYSRTLDFARFREIADEVGAFLLADIAHIAGLVATGHHPSPLPHAHVVTSTTHKTLRGPRSGIILSNDEALGKRIDKMIFPGIQGGPLEHVIAGKAVAFFEAMQPEFKAYSQAVIDNARALSEAMAERGYRIVSGGTDNHLFVVDLRSLEMTGHKASRTLDRVHITVSKSTIPFDPEKPYYGSGIRIGSPAITTRGFTSAEMPAVAELIDRALRGDEADDVRANVIALARRFPMP